MNAQESLEQTIERFERTRDEAATADEQLRRRIREAHEATQTAKTATHELRDVLRTVRKKAEDAVDAEVTKAVKRELEELGPALSSIRNDFLRRVEEGFARLERLAFTGTAKKGARDLRDLDDDEVPLPSPAPAFGDLARHFRDVRQELHPEDGS